MSEWAVGNGSFFGGDIALRRNLRRGRVKVKAIFEQLRQ
jgi:hypothetical protein